MRRLRRLATDEAGQSYIEYVVVAAVALLVILGAVQFFFGGVANLFQRIGNTLNGL